MGEIIKKKGADVNQKAMDIISGKVEADQKVVVRVKELTDEIKKILSDSLKLFEDIKPELIKDNEKLKEIIGNLSKGKKGLKGYKRFKENIPKLFQKKM